MPEVHLCWFCGKRISEPTPWVLIHPAVTGTPEHRAHVECAEKAYEDGRLALGPKG